MRRINKIAAYSLLFLSITACGKKLDSIEYVKYMNNPENGFIVKKNYGPYIIAVQYRTVEYNYALQKSILKMSFEEYKKSNDLLCFVLNIRKDGSNEEYLEQDVNDYSGYIDKMDYYTNLVSNDVYVEINGNKYPCVHSLLERTYGIGKGNSLLFYFENNEKDFKKIAFIYNDRYLSTGRMTFKFNTEKNIPTLIL